MTIQELKSKLTDEHIRNLLVEMGATFYYEDDDMWITDTICHHGTKPKLYYYKDSKSFHCYTECGQMDILGLVINYNGYENSDISEAITWICIKLNLDNFQYGFGNSKQKQISDWEFINQMTKTIRKENKNKDFDLVPYDNKILNIFQDLYHQSWIDEGISIESMKKYNIKYCIWQQQIIIPHYDKYNNLVGVRARNTIENEVEMYGKYLPFKIGNKFYNHNLSQNLFGLNHNIKAIERKKKIMLVEAEKSVMQADTMFGDDNFVVSLCGCNLSEHQKNIILSLDIREVIIALDKQWNVLNDDECKKWISHIKNKFIKRLSPFLKVTVLWDSNDLLDYKDSPTDKGKEILLKLMDSKLYT